MIYLKPLEQFLAHSWLNKQLLNEWMNEWLGEEDSPTNRETEDEAGERN